MTIADPAPVYRLADGRRYRLVRTGVTIDGIRGCSLLTCTTSSRDAPNVVALTPTELAALEPIGGRQVPKARVGGVRSSKEPQRSTAQAGKPNREPRPAPAPAPRPPRARPAPSPTPESPLYHPPTPPPRRSPYARVAKNVERLSARRRALTGLAAFLIFCLLALLTSTTSTPLVTWLLILGAGSYIASLALRYLRIALRHLSGSDAR